MIQRHVREDETKSKEKSNSNISPILSEIMKGFIILLLATVGVSVAAPQYNYQPVGHGGGSFLGGGGAAGNFGLSPSFGGGFSHGGIGSHGANVIQSNHQPIVSKQFYIHSAPEEHDDGGADKVINLGPSRKNYRVVFIKAPNAAVGGGRIRFQAPANEEKTVIYVLSKKTDLADIQADVQQSHAQNTKPEVHFIKYKTNEEAAHAQRTIQAQYDQLGGTSQVSDEGVAPVQSFIGALGDSNAPAASQIAGTGASFGSTGAGFSGGIGGGVSAGSSSYLPPSI
ncbi:uncharacterized protein LOC129613878 [Condylostylus longicornis]|uniref:uncharacterized protein LOC129613878 n=1 Tax=Condylostylus longicornis TaxID=2530218 RepID=UPI00244DEDDC|nr:uncharacterized protein LOC129613878 [Condylostylus longicornis]